MGKNMGNKTKMNFSKDLNKSGYRDSRFEEDSLPEIKKTRNYEIFKLVESNRPVDKNHLKNLKTSISQNNLLPLRPILVNRDMEIIDGQHRFTAAKDLGLDIYYVIGLELVDDSIILLNTNQKNWTIENYINYYATLGNENYIKFKELVKDIGLPCTYVTIWMGEYGGRIDRLIKSGQYIFDMQEKKLERLCKIRKIFEFLKEKKYFKSILFSTPFHKALYKFLTNEIVDFDYFFESLEKRYEFIKKTQSKDQYVEMFVNIYNWKRLNMNKISIIRRGNSFELG
jgi:hypothetical protein